MPNFKATLVSSFALFSLFFGAGNLILPPLLGFQSGSWWWLVALGFAVSAVLIPIMGILAHAKLQGTIYDFGKKVSPTFSLVYSILIYVISIGLPSPRTAAVTHEIAVQPFFNTSPLVTSIVYFSLVFVFVINRSSILDILGKVLTPAIILILVLIIGITIFTLDFNFGETGIISPFSDGILEGYQTFDAIGAVVVGGVIIVSINLKSNASYKDKKTLIRNAGWLAGFSLFIIYAGLILSGALNHTNFETNITRIDLLSGISKITLGYTANVLLSILVSLACFTTAIGIVTGTSDFIKDRLPNARHAYLITAIMGCLLGILMGQFNVAYIITIAFPALMFIYPITIILILLNVVSDKWASPIVFKAVVITTIVFSIPDFLGSLGDLAPNKEAFDWIPLSEYRLGWVLPAVVIYAITNVFAKKGKVV
ncbi:branched-chain amino acid transport system II carrier protein [Arenibacter sp. TNZ]|jgi:LIVCS family branched-chain amino acid:cation transporter|uniref:branched-chain amino acid transport system II carrier protein n=1 Tax=Arenibacter TaxID=178469 RepID=UPI000CD3FEEA|nr:MULTISPECIES: branched-chain amino acid transport system II carrier protein [Arenibacter]MCM4172179.1 branched-chain amino acid transport system II carrier protein [Arenibacter sp. TNZ]